MSNRQIVERYWTAFVTGDLDTLERLVHTDIVVTYPQSGEVIRGRENLMATIRNYPVALPEGSDAKLEGTAETASVSSPLLFGIPVITVVAGSDVFVGEAVYTYANGDVFNVAVIVKIREGMIAEETTYFAAPFEAPEWRSQWVEN